jgi:hypothetical protein
LIVAKTAPSQRTTVNLGPREWDAAEKMQQHRDLPSVAMAVRVSVTVASAVDLIETERNMRIECVAADGRRFAYSLNRPKLLYELDAKGVRTGRTIDLFAVADEKPKKSKLKAIRGGKALAAN